jgi:hypothetical protein
MTTAAIPTGLAILAWIGLAIGAVVLVVVISLFNRVRTPAREIEAYANDIAEAGQAIADNVEIGDELARTSGLATAVPGLAAAYLQKLQGGGS